MTKNGKWKWTIGVILSIVIAVSSVIWDASKKSSAIDTNKGNIAEMKPVVSESEKAIIGIERDISHLAQKVEENSVVQQQILILQQDNKKVMQDILREVKR